MIYNHLYMYFNDASIYTSIFVSIINFLVSHYLDSKKEKKVKNIYNKIMG